MYKSGEGAKILDELAARTAAQRRQAAAVEAVRQRGLVQQVARMAPNVTDILRQVRLEPAAHLGVADAIRHGRALADQGRFLDKPGTSLGLSVRGKPFDLEWTSRLDFGSPAADRTTGAMELFVSSGSIPFDSDAEHTFNGAGLGVFFRPKAKASLVRVAPYLPFSFKWHDDSTIEVARNRGELGVLVRQVGGPIVVDSRVPLWNDGTSWYMEHSDEEDDTFTASNTFFASSDHDLEVWFWFNSSIDFNRSSGVFDFGSSRASNSLFAQLGWIVFEETQL